MIKGNLILDSNVTNLKFLLIFFNISAELFKNKPDFFSIELVINKADNRSYEYS